MFEGAINTLSGSHGSVLNGFLSCRAAKVFQAIQGHWLSACLGVLMDLKIPEILHAQEKPIEFAQVPIVIKLVCVKPIYTGEQHVNLWLVCYKCSSPSWQASPQQDTTTFTRC